VYSLNQISLHVTRLECRALDVRFFALATATHPILNLI